MTRSISTLIKGFVGAMMICVCFFKIKELVGRQQESLGVLDYVATYLGGSFDLFSQYMRETRGAFKGSRRLCIKSSRQSVPKFVTCRLYGRLFCYRENPGEMAGCWKSIC